MWPATPRRATRAGPALTPAAWQASAPGRIELLAAEWLAKWGRSIAQFPAGMPAGEHPSFARLILDHPQFQRA